MKVPNTGASVRARLLNKARADGMDFQYLLTRYALERLLYRLSISPERHNFLLICRHAGTNTARLSTLYGDCRKT